MNRKLLLTFAGGMMVGICGMCALCIFPVALLLSPAGAIAQAYSPQDYQTTGTGEDSSGEALFKQYGCVACHHADGSGVGPSLVGIIGQTVSLADGTTVTVDENYLRRSILTSQADLVAGYPPIMPKFDGQISDAEVDLLVEYIQSLSNP